MKQFSVVKTVYIKQTELYTVHANDTREALEQFNFVDFAGTPHRTHTVYLDRRVDIHQDTLPELEKKDE